MGNSFGHTFRITTYGESHGGGVGVVIDGCPAGIEIADSTIQDWLERRRPGKNKISSPRDEKDQFRCLSGMEDNITLGTPISLMVENKNVKKEDYKDVNQVFRPSHADFTTQEKFGKRASSGGGRASARETIGRVAAGAIAEAMLTKRFPDLKVVAYVKSIKDISLDSKALPKITRQDVSQTEVNCPDIKTAEKMKNLILETQKKGDSLGGIIECRIENCPTGFGEPVFDKLDAELAKAMLSIPATKGFEVGSGFAATELYGSENNDAFKNDGGQITTLSNNSGGIQGGISNGQTIVFRVAFKPVATIFKDQSTINDKGQNINFKPKSGRHDPCVLPRAVPIVESMALLVLADMHLRQKRND